ncbi:MAG: alpha/beta fold hydrolase [Chloroflexi bacterium]|nr:alpha/beta fold hydrolase [Chloroflexota bacterium]
MPRTHANGIEIEYESFGDQAHVPLLLLSGGGAQLTFWQEAFCEQLASHGFCVVRLDNRDVGLSTYFDAAGVPDVPAVRDGRELAPYLLDDMAQDTVDVIDALGAPSAHVVGISLGGYIAQVMAINHPDRVLSIVSMASGVGGSDNIYGGPPGGWGDDDGESAADLTFEDSVERRLDDIQWMSTARYFDRDHIRPRVIASMHRARNPAGAERQAAAVHAGASRAAALRDIRVPTLVLHGAEDPHLPVENAHRTADAIPGSRLVIIPDLAHDLPDQKWDQVIDLIVGHARQAEARPVA